MFLPTLVDGLRRRSAVADPIPVVIKRKPRAVLRVVARGAPVFGVKRGFQSRLIDVCARRSVAALAADRLALRASCARLETARQPVARCVTLLALGVDLEATVLECLPGV